MNREAFEAFKKKRRPKYQPTDDGMSDRSDWELWQAATAAERERCAVKTGDKAMNREASKQWSDDGEPITLNAAAEDADEWLALIERLHGGGKGPWKFSDPTSLSRLQGCRATLRKFLDADIAIPVGAELNPFAKALDEIARLTDLLGKANALARIRAERIAELEKANSDLATAAAKVAQMQAEIERLRGHIKHIGNDALRAENHDLREWIKATGEHYDICTYNVLGDLCDGCQCKRAANAGDKL